MNFASFLASFLPFTASYYIRIPPSKKEKETKKAHNEALTSYAAHYGLLIVSDLYIFGSFTERDIYVNTSILIHN